MWGESSKNCEDNCQCSGLITENFKINSGNNATKNRREEAIATNFKSKIHPYSLKFTRSPLKSPLSQLTPKRRVLGELQPPISPLLMTPLTELKNSPLIQRNLSSPKTKSLKRTTTKISRIFEERSRFKMANKENESSFISETFVKLHVEEETRDATFGDSFQSSISQDRISSWSLTKLDFKDALQTSSYKVEKKEVQESYVPQKDVEVNIDQDCDETLHDLEEEFDADNFDQCTKYEIISTDSPNIISRGRTARKISGRIDFGAPLSENEPSTSFNARAINFEESFEFPSPAVKRSSIGNVSVKKSLRFSGTPTKNILKHEKSDSSIGSMSTLSSPSTGFRLFTSESTASMESGFMSELDEPVLGLEECSSSPKMENFNDLLSGQIKENVGMRKEIIQRPCFNKSLSLNPASKARVSLFSIDEGSGSKKTNKREQAEEQDICNKRRKSNFDGVPNVITRPVLQRAFSENHASIKSALARSDMEPDLIGDFSLPFALPLTNGDHSDLKSISCETLAGLLKGDYEDSISDFKVIDCRYPYEYEGGHIKGAINLYTTSQVEALINKPLEARDLDTKRSILVFHCEFSLERGPKLSRFLRSSDRAKNKENYPSLHYPEVYLLHEGYRKFYQMFPECCLPNGYTAMLDPKHKDLLRRHRSKSQIQQPSSTQHKRHRLLL